MTSILIISVVTGIYTVVGGLKAVVVTETIQTVLLIGGSIIVTVLAMLALPEAGITSWADSKRRSSRTSSRSSGPTRRPKLTCSRFLIGYWVLGVWYWCTDQTIVQRVLAAKTERDAQIGPLFAGFLKILPVFILVFPGTLAYVLFRDQIGDDADQALPFLIQELVPTGLRGLISAGLLAALMSTIAAALNSCATLVAVDIVQRLRPNTSDRQQVQIGRWSAVGVMILAMAWSTQGEKFTSIFAAVQQIAAALAPPITAVFLMGVFWRRGTQQAALATLIIGFILGTAAFLVDVPLVGTPPTQPLLSETRLLTTGLGLPFLRQACVLTFLCMGIFTVVSWMTPPPPREKIEGLTWENPLSVFTTPYTEQGIDPRRLAGILCAVLTVLYFIFR